MAAITVEQGMETFRDSKGRLFATTETITIGETAGVIGVDKGIDISGIVTKTQEINGETFYFVNVGRDQCIPRKKNELAVPIEFLK